MAEDEMMVECPPKEKKTQNAMIERESWLERIKMVEDVEIWFGSGGGGGASASAVARVCVCVCVCICVCVVVVVDPGRPLGCPCILDSGLCGYFVLYCIVLYCIVLYCIVQ